jgi:hypothetical protein
MGADKVQELAGILARSIRPLRAGPTPAQSEQGTTGVLAYALA